MIGYWPDTEKSRAEARRLLQEAGQENLTFELLNRNVDEPYKFNALWVIGEWSKIGVKVTQRVVPTGPFGEALRRPLHRSGLRAAGRSARRSNSAGSLGRAYAAGSR